MKVAMVGAGAWGTALAISAAQQHQVVLWARNPVQAQALQRERCNTQYLPGGALPSALHIRHGPVADLLPGLDLLVLATPVAALRSTLESLAPHMGATPVVWVCKGFAPEDGGPLPHEVAHAVSPSLMGGALSGPSFAIEVARGQPTALVAASAHALVRERMAAVFHSPSLRVYGNDDIVGVEVGGAVKNVLAIATGLCDGMQLGLNARAALITRGLTEITRLGLAMGARADTFMGLSGLGDLVLTATGDLSRNRQVGMALAQGKSLPHILQALGHVAEGVYTAHTVVQRAQHLGVDMPIAQAVVSVLQGHTTPQQAVAALMGRGAKGE
jgi:glycerol-3-phosphate dehydrogenase (NAD(P)+)